MISSSPTSRRRRRIHTAIAWLLGSFLCGQFASPDQEGPTIRSLKNRAEITNGWLKTRLRDVLPGLMRREGVDMWIVICREHAEDPVFFSLVPAPSMFAWRLSMLMFYDRGAAGVECLSVNRYGSGDFNREMADYYAPAWEPENLDPWQRLAEVVRARRPKTIAINESKTFAFADGLSASLKIELVRALGPDYAGRLVSAERLAVGWLEYRTPEELRVYPQIVALTHGLIRGAFSHQAIVAGVTTIDDLGWWFRRRIAELQLATWFQPTFYVSKHPGSDPKDARIVQRGDLLRCDVGINYLGLNSDIQEVAYVLCEGETDAPAGLKDALVQANRLQDILAGELKEGASGNAILLSALAKARAAGLKPKIYSHPLGYHGHAAGPRIGLGDMQEGVPGMGDFPLHVNTVWAVELSVHVPIPEWDGREITLALEQDAAFTAAGASFLDGRQTCLHLIR
jgi:hypothetical protein